VERVRAFATSFPWSEDRPFGVVLYLLIPNDSGLAASTGETCRAQADDHLTFGQARCGPPDAERLIESTIFCRASAHVAQVFGDPYRER
jgi:hypothetical protein